MMKKHKLGMRHLYLLFFVFVLTLGSAWLLFLSGTTSLNVVDVNKSLPGFASYFGGVQTLVSVSWLLEIMTAVSASGLLTLLSVYFLMYFAGWRCGRMLNELLLLIPSMPDEESIAVSAEHGLKVENGEIFIGPKYWRLAKPEALSHCVTHLLYLYSRDHLEELISGEHTVFHKLALMLLANADYDSIRDFSTQMSCDKSLMGELLAAALVRLPLEEEEAEVQGEIAKVIKREQSALLQVRNMLAQTTARVHRVAPAKNLVPPEMDSLTVVSEAPMVSILTCQPLVINHPPITENLEDDVANSNQSVAASADDEVTSDHSFVFTPEPAQSGVWELADGASVKVS